MATKTTERRRPTILTVTRVPARAPKTPVLVYPQPVNLDATQSLVVDAPSSRLRDVAEIIARARRRRKLEGVLLRQDSSYEYTRHVLTELHLTNAPQLLVAQNDEVRRRVWQAVAWGAQDQFIADAEAMGDTLVVRTCSFERIEVQLTDLTALRGLSFERRRQFELDADGGFLYWPAADVHLDLDALRLATDPVRAEQVRHERIRHDERLGRAIAVLRARHGLAQTQIEGLSERQVRRIEQGSRPRLSTLSSLAAAHGLDVDAYLREVAEAMAVV
jgi:hypothetical protein